ncbi:MAG: hypothetical protein AB1540_03940 [Bdellovibrionota bacterium]
MKFKNTEIYFRRNQVVGKVRCNICHRTFRALSRFNRFCNKCKQFDELYRFSGWLPEKVAP